MFGPGQRFQVAHPYVKLTAEGSPLVRVETPQAHVSIAALVAERRTVTAETCKAARNEAFKREDFLEAVDWYTILAWNG